MLTAAQPASIIAKGGLLLVGVGSRLLISAVPVGNLSPAVVIAPLLVVGVGVLR